MAKKKEVGTIRKHLITPKKYLESNTWGNTLINGFLVVLACALVVFCVSKVYSFFVEEPEEKTAKALVEANSNQFKAKIHTSVPTDIPLVTDGRLMLSVVVENIGHENDFEIPPSKIISRFDGYEEYSNLVVSFLDPQKNKLGETKLYPVTSTPILPGKKSTEININETIPTETSSVELTLDCEYINQSSPCKDPKVEKLFYTSIQILKILIVDASRKTDNIKVPPFRAEIESLYGNSNFLKAAWSSSPVGPKHSKQAFLLYNKAKGHAPESNDTKKILQALNKIYGRFYTTNVADLDGGSFDQFAYQLSDCGIDDSCEKNLYWDNLSINSNRFSPSISTRNNDIDYVIFLPSNF